MRYFFLAGDEEVSPSNLLTIASAFFPLDFDNDQITKTQLYSLTAIRFMFLCKLINVRRLNKIILQYVPRC